MAQSEVIHPFLYQATSYPKGTLLSGYPAHFWITPVLSLACWQELYELVEKEGSVDFLIHQGEKERQRWVQEDAIWMAPGCQPPLRGQQAAFSVISFPIFNHFFPALILIWKSRLKHCTWSVSQLPSAHGKHPAWWVTPRNKSQRRFLRFYWMNGSTCQLKERPFYLKPELKPSVPLYLQAAVRWCLDLAPSAGLAVQKALQSEWCGLAAVPNAAVLNGKVSMCDPIEQPRLPQQLLLHTDALQLVTLRPREADIPHQWLPQMLAGINDDLTACWLPNPCPPGDAPHAVTAWKETNCSRRVRFPLAPMFYKVCVDLSGRSRCLNWL